MPSSLAFITLSGHYNIKRLISSIQLIRLAFFEVYEKRASQLLSGKRTLPSWGQMMRPIEEFYSSKGYCCHSKAYLWYCRLHELPSLILLCGQLFIRLWRSIL
ncbi:hypothetical protein SADUNF_Sadunf12G0050700 [Salix dunnii]|uniref:Uncharacterized protein n=1 Tax=Salix dunnii TaxID=1413687 RepID=A0A835MS69_9ROSI|nr:hypothetical protein SADUNF_Sadunf12G0050700 [Salix dunnii]